MSLLVGTLDGVYRFDADFEGTVPVLDVATNRLRTFDGFGTFAATSDGLYRSNDGNDWQRVGEFAGGVESVAVSPDGNRWFAGTNPAAVYVSEDDGETWTECESLQRLSDRDRWRDRARGGDAAVRTMAVHPEAPDRLTIGVDPGGVYVSVDRGETWAARRDGVHDDVSHLLSLGVDEYLASCRNGLYRTTDAGRTWLRVDTDSRDFWFNDFREALQYEDTRYTAASGWGPAAPGGGLFETRDGETKRLPYPGEKDSFVVSWTVHEGSVYAGTMAVADDFEPYDEARILRREETGWFEVCTVPAAALSLATI
jgi:photosystem II stability/assembly factor-like uncharacterized protein